MDEVPYNEIDLNIRTLVKAIADSGIKTYASCEGHLNESKHQHPWVAFLTNDQERIKIDSALRQYNSEHVIQWTYGIYWLEPLTYKEACHLCCSTLGCETKPFTQDLLDELQSSSEELAQFLAAQLK